MLPPIEDSVLQSNPKFSVLHATLTKNFLNPNGSSKNHPAQKERDAVTESYEIARLGAEKVEIIKSALGNFDVSPPSAPSSALASSKTRPAATSSTALPQELLELILLLSSHLTCATLPQCSLKLLQNSTQWRSLPTYLPQIGALLSSHLQTQASALTRVKFPNTNASYLHRSIPKLVPAVEESQREIAGHKKRLEDRRVGLVSKVGMLLGLYHLASTLVILHLEQTTHGSMARHLKARSEYLSLTAQQVALEVKEKKAKGEKMVYTEPVKAALIEYMYSLRDARERLKDRKREVERTLWGYGVGRQPGEGGDEKGKIMRSIADKYGELQREVRDVTKDVQRLKGR